MKQFSSIFYMGGKYLVAGGLVLVLLAGCGNNEGKVK